MSRIKVLIADDTTLMRQGIRSLLEQNRNLELVGEAESAQKATDVAKDLSPDVILLDQDMPGLDSAEAVRLIKENSPKTEIIALAEVPNNEQAFRLLEAGASGYVLKDINPESLIGAIEGICSGKTFMNPHVARQLVERFRALVREKSDREGLHLGGLTSRELEILLEMAKGSTDREVARKMYVSTTTIKSHVRSIFRKIGARNRTQAVVYVLRSGTFFR